MYTSIYCISLQYVNQDLYGCNHTHLRCPLSRVKSIGQFAFLNWMIRFLDFFRLVKNFIYWLLSIFKSSQFYLGCENSANLGYIFQVCTFHIMYLSESKITNFTTVEKKHDFLLILYQLVRYVKLFKLITSLKYVLK